MRSFRQSVLLFAGIGVLTGVIGCGEEARDGRGTSRPSSPAPAQSTSDASKSKTGGTAPEQTGATVESEAGQAAFPKLPEGAGPIDPDAPEEFTKTESGLRYRILRKSEGEKPKLNDRVVADYKGWFDDGRQFDSSYERGEPIDFPLKSGIGGVIVGWVEGLPLIGVGGMIELEIPGDLAYGPQGRPGVPPNATLHFLIELKEIK